MANILLGVSSSVAIYKSCELVRMFKKNGDNVKVVMTENSTNLVKPLLFETLSENSVHVNLFEERDNMAHISLKDFADIFIVCPATANTIGKFANGIADNLIASTFLAVKCPVLIAPAMNPNMWTNGFVLENVEKLKKHKIEFVIPVEGKVVCNDIGIGKLADIKDIYERAQSLIK